MYNRQPQGSFAFDQTRVIEKWREEEEEGELVVSVGLNCRC